MYAQVVTARVRSTTGSYVFIGVCLLTGSRESGGTQDQDRGTHPPPSPEENRGTTTSPHPQQGWVPLPP